MSNSNSTAGARPLKNAFIRLDDNVSQERQARAGLNKRQELSTMAAIVGGLDGAGILFGSNGLGIVMGENLYYPKICEYNVDIFNPFK